MNALIYGLIDPRNQELRYVGRTIQPLELRLQQHLYVAKRGKDTALRCPWIRSLRSVGLKPEIFTIEEVDSESAQKAEETWVNYFKYIGANLLNVGNPLIGGTRSYVIDWTPEIIAKLGTIPDGMLAKELGVDRKTISYHRRVRRIPQAEQITHVPPPPMGGWNRIELPQHIIDRLGTMPDRQLCKEIGVSKYVIQRARNELGIPDYAAIHGHPTQYKAGNSPARWEKPGARAEVPQHVIDRLGIVSDTKLAQEIGVSRDAIVKQRKARGIPSIKQR